MGTNYEQNHKPYTISVQVHTLQVSQMQCLIQ